MWKTVKSSPVEKFTISSSCQDSYDEHPHHDGSSESQQQQKQQTDQHGYEQTTERREQEEGDKEVDGRGMDTLCKETQQDRTNRKCSKWQKRRPVGGSVRCSSERQLTWGSTATRRQSPQRSGRRLLGRWSRSRCPWWETQAEVCWDCFPFKPWKVKSYRN